MAVLALRPPTDAEDLTATRGAGFRWDDRTAPLCVGWEEVASTGATMTISNDVFISYRREMGFAWAKLVWDDLRDHDIDAFLDLENVRDAGNFDTRIMRQIEGRPYFLIILTKGSLARCRNEGDWLREELEHAVAVDRVIVPLIITPFDFDEADDALDDELAHAVRSANGVALVPDYFDAAMERLRVDRLQPIELEVRTLAPSDETFAEEARQRASQLPPPPPPVDVANIPPPPDTPVPDQDDLVEPLAHLDDKSTDQSDAAVPDRDVIAARGTAIDSGQAEPSSQDSEGATAGLEQRNAAAEDSAPPPRRTSSPPAVERSQTGSRRWLVAMTVAAVVALAGAVALVLSGLVGGDDGPTDRMETEDYLGAGDGLETDDGSTVLEMGDDGVLRGITDGVEWFSEPVDSRAVPGSVARMQKDGNFVIYESEDTEMPADATYATRTQGNSGAYLILLDGRFEIRSANDVRLFTSSFP